MIKHDQAWSSMIKHHVALWCFIMLYDPCCNTLDDIMNDLMMIWGFDPVLKRIFILGRIEYRILFVWWKLNESNIEYYSLIKKIFEYYLNTWKYLNIRIYSNKFAKKCKGFGIQSFHIPRKHLSIRKTIPHIDSHQ